MNIYQVDAFADRVFEGNPASIVPLENWPDSHVMQQIAIENNLSETAFFVKEDDGSFRIRWFTTKTEVNLCGHATLATAHVLFQHLDYAEKKIVFQSNSGRLTVEQHDGFYWMNFPSNPPEPIPVPKLIPEAIGMIPLYTGVNTDLLVLLQDEQSVKDLKPDLIILKKMEVRGVIFTALGSDVDFVSRFFAPSVGIPEDPVTGSAHTLLTPFWSKRLNKKKLKARQISQRGGNLHCLQKGDRVEIGGPAVTYLTGSISI
ncbi:MAG: PhzF family phenazine biosynthesis protein [Balneolaceae bacterium]